MNEIKELLNSVKTQVGIQLNGNYLGYSVRRMTSASSIAESSSNHGYHFEVTGKDSEMLLYPIVTSSSYEADPTAEEKSRYRLKISINLYRKNLLQLCERIINSHSHNLSEPLDYFINWKNRLESSPDIIKSFSHVRFSKRSTGQRQIEVGESNDEEHFIFLRRCLLVDSSLITLHLGGASYDMVGAGDFSLPANVPKIFIADKIVKTTIDASCICDESSLDKISYIINDFKKATASVRFITDTSCVINTFSALLSKRFLILTGLSGSGKTKLAQAFARWIGPKLLCRDPFHPVSEIKSDGLSYFVVSANDDRVDLCDSRKADKVDASLERRMINEWASFIQKRGFSQTTPSIEIHNEFINSSRQESRCEFHSHLKAAAFALIEAEKSDEEAKNYELVPVGADWTGNENILGYPHGLEEGKYVTKQALDLIHRAYDHADIPHFLILDEMNLSHVERYFADLLSAIESDEPIRLHHDNEREAGNGRNVRPRITLPQNLFIIGTVNVDETTYMFSPKVLDRANVIEFRMDESEVASFLDKPVKPNLGLLDGKGASFAKAFVDDAKADATVPEEVKDTFAAEMLLFFKVLQAYGCEYGYRVAHEAARFMHFYRELGQGKLWDRSAEKGKGAWVDKTEDGRFWFHDAFDALVVQKFLPKLNGSEAKLRKPLWALAHLCSEQRDWSGYPNEASRKDEVDKISKAAKEKGESKSKDNDSPTSIASKLLASGAQPLYPLSFAKIERMWRAAQTNGFTSFAESI